MMFLRAAGRTVFATLIMSNLMACATRLPDKAAGDMTDTEVLIAFGHATRGKVSDATVTDGLDREVQTRQLITAAEAIKVQDATIYEGINSAAALASFGAPEKLGTSPNFAGVQAWVYPYDTDNSGTLYVAQGRVIGYRIAPQRNDNGTLKWARGGRTFPLQRFQFRQCRQFADSNAVITNCPDLDVGKNGTKQL